MSAVVSVHGKLTDHCEKPICRQTHLAGSLLSHPALCVVSFRIRFLGLKSVFGFVEFSGIAYGETDTGGIAFGKGTYYR